MIFPLDRTATAMKKNEESPKASEQTFLGDRSRIALHSIMDSWTWRHGVRATLPFIAALIALSSKMQILE